MSTATNPELRTGLGGRAFYQEPPEIPKNIRCLGIGVESKVEDALAAFLDAFRDPETQGYLGFRGEIAGLGQVAGFRLFLEQDGVYTLGLEFEYGHLGGDNALITYERHLADYPPLVIPRLGTLFSGVEKICSGMAKSGVCGRGGAKGGRAFGTSLIYQQGDRAKVCITDWPILGDAEVHPVSLALAGEFEYGYYPHALEVLKAVDVMTSYHLEAVQS